MRTFFISFFLFLPLFTWSQVSLLTLDDFGGVGDGVTLNDSAWAAALAYAGQSEIIIPKGTYLFSGTIRVPEFRQIIGQGGRGSILKKKTKGVFILAGSETSSAVSHGVKIENLTIMMEHDSCVGIKLAGTAYAKCNYVYIEGKPGVGNKSIGIEIHGGNAANFLTSLTDIGISHVNIGLVLNSDGTGVHAVTNVLTKNLASNGDVTRYPGNGSTGILITHNNGHGSSFIGGNLENTNFAIRSTGAAVRCNFIGVRFEANTEEINLSSTTTNFSFNNCKHLTGLINLNGSLVDFISNDLNSGNGFLDNKLNGKLLLGKDLEFYNVTGDRSILMTDVTNYTGKILLQPGVGSAGTGAGLLLYGHDHAARPGSFIAGISVGAGVTGTSTEGRFAIMDQGIGGGNERFTVLRSGKVGIGIASPTESLHVVGGAWITTTLKDSSGDPGTPGQLLISTGTGTNYIDMATAMNIYNNTLEVVEASSAQAAQTAATSLVGEEFWWRITGETGLIKMRKE